MKGETTWSYAPYRPPMFDSGDITVCRIAPVKGCVTVDWLGLGDSSAYTFLWRIRGEEDWQKIETGENTVTLTDLDDECDYECMVTCGEKKSRVRLFRTGFVPGDAVINYLHPEDGVYAFSGQYLCSPSIIRAPGGYLLCSMDVFKGKEPQDLSLIFRSDDDGKTWRYVTDLFPCFWGKLFVHRGEIYMLSVNTEYGDLLIGKSTDGGFTFTKPVVLLRGSCGHRHPGVHKNPQPIIEYKGRLWTTLEWGSWTYGTHAAMCASISCDSDLLDPSAWAFTDPVPYDPKWEGAAKGQSAGCIEGCMTIAPDGELYNIMRYQIEKCEPSFGRAVVMKVDYTHPDSPLLFDRIIDFPGNHSKFMIKRHEESGYYISLVSYLDENHPKGRNLLSLIKSRDLDTWEKVTDIFDYTDLDEMKVGFQYIDFFFEGDSILFQSRTAFNNAANFHDANYAVFSRIDSVSALLHGE